MFLVNIYVDEKLQEKTKRLKGVRLLRQDPVETLFTFICSSNNNIQRISVMVDKLCMTYGQHIAQVSFAAQRMNKVYVLDDGLYCWNITHAKL